YLFKVLDVREMLSIQVHPDKEEALNGFAHEESMGIELNAPNRNYKDGNHKPEVMVALSDFWLLHGFKQPGDLKQTLTDVPQLRSLLPIFEETGYSGLYRHVMELPLAESDAMLQPLVQKEVRRRSFHESERTEPGYWVGEYYLNREAKHIDKGILAASRPNTSILPN
ncbi:MAG: mannose-6-phosphate isomerase, partial [Chitinophagaceae bacterium]|nr:mannose-6-phosphate isomerase [Chitinophagaceae bacterium]